MIIIKKLSYPQYWDVNNLYGWAMPQKLSVNNFEWIEDASQFNEDFVKKYNEKNDEKYFDVQYPEKLHELHMIYHFYLKEWKLHDKTEYVMYIQNLKQALNSRLVLKKVHRVVKFLG